MLLAKLLGLIAVLLQANRVEAIPGPLLLSMVPPTFERKCVMQFGSSFPVILTNTSAKPVRVWRDWCSEGHNNISLEFRIAGVDRLIVRKQANWKRNFPDAAELAPGESIVFNVALSKEKWNDLDLLNEQVNQKVQLRVRYEVPLDKPAVEHRVFVGQMQTQFQEYTVKKP